MPNNADIKEIGALAKTLLDGKEYFVGSLVDRLRKAADKYPHDQAIRTMELAFNKIAKSQGPSAIMNQSQIQSYYDDVSGLGNRNVFMEELGDLLLEDRVSKVANYNEDHAKSLRDNGNDLDIYDRAKIAEMEGLWGAPNEKEIKRAFAESGRRGIEIELESLGFAQPTVEVMDQTDHFVVFAAEVATRKGRVPFLIPAEVKQASVLMPSVFVSGDSFKDLTADNIRAHLNSDITNMKHASPKAVIETLNRLTGKDEELFKEAGIDDGMTNVELSSPGFFMDPVGHNDPNVNRLPIDDKMPEVPMPPALQGLSDSVIKETLVEAGLSYDRDTVIAAKTMVSNELKLANISHETIKVESEFDGGITVATNIVGSGGKKTISVPVEILNGRVLMPKSFISGPMAGPFNEKDLRAFANSEEGESTSPFLNDKIDMSFAQLHEFIMKKAAYGDFIEVTDALGIVSEKFGEQLHRIAHDDLMDLLKAGYVEEEKPLTAMERFAEEAARKAKDKESQIKMTNNAMLFYPNE